MSKSSKAKKKIENLQEKRRRKQSNKARYAALKLAGENTKSVRSLRQKRKTKLVNKTDHTMGNCGNIGCKKCVISK